MASTTPPPTRASHHAPAGSMSRDARASRGAVSPIRAQRAQHDDRSAPRNRPRRAREPGFGGDRERSALRDATEGGQPWRNDQCLDTDPAGFPSEVVADLGTQWDWLAFYYALTRPAEPDTLSVLQLSRLYVEACSIARGTAGPRCTPGQEPAWRTNLSASTRRGGLVDAADALRDANLLTVEQEQELRRLGDEYGVDTNVGP